MFGMNKKRFPENWQEDYERMLPTALRAAGWYIQKYFKDKNVGFPEFRWIQTTLQKPAFQHLCFAYRGNLYSVLIEIKTWRGIYLLEQDKQNQLRECRQNDLIACTIPLLGDDFSPLVSDVHLLSTDTRKPIEVSEKAEQVKMSPWEIHSLGVQVVRDQLVRDGMRILSYCDVLQIDPQIWFEKANGEKCYVMVETLVGTLSEDACKKLNQNFLLKFIDYGGYYAKVRVVDPENPTCRTLFRDQSYFIDYRGLQYIEKRAAKVGTENKDIFIIREC